MIDDFEQYLRQYIPALSDKQRQLIRSKSVVRKVRRRQMLLHDGEVCQQKILVLRGLLRTYSITADGSEHIMKFSSEHDWITDSDSYFNRTPSELNIDALEASDVVLWSYDDFEALRTAIPEISTFSEKLITKNISVTQKRILMNISATTEEKYQYFIDTYPDIFRRVPLHMVASYLGVSRETLTRIRQGQAVAAKG
ncbi:Crp/Fnr family transcriptional regulator [Spirosoma sp. BT702]|uniref:Crp/Fnr family transcriptional regulator n=1 Tax=Spirosoma profusum TaxID=2771354 RepID=A0A926XV92_9BACT|nr:Crp/Fnr family transcriptional regulator [Spirosoma profusum]MBD2701239.1 Crp/Fnr family transcriptional regulator [Spirosoma profusum]